MKKIKIVKKMQKKPGFNLEIRSDLMKKYCRTWQAGAAVMMDLLPWRTPKVLRGPKAIRKLPDSVTGREFKKVLIVTGPRIRSRGLLDSLLEVMQEKKLQYAIFDNISQNPTDQEVEQGATLYKKEQCDCMIAFGGGSVMDCAKAIGARIARQKKSVKQLQGQFRVLRPIPVIFAVPTTAGSGSEATIAAVITEEKTHHKASINDLHLMPRYVVLDPELTVGLPAQTTAVTGMDALCHAVEAYTNDRYNTDFERKMCRTAVRLIHDNLYTAYKDGSNLEARSNMQEAAFNAGRAFTRGGVGYVHAIAHTLSGLYGTPHGLAVSILLPHVMRAYGKKAQDKLANLCDICGIEVDSPDGMIPAEVRAEAFLNWMEELKRNLDIPEYPDMIRREDVGQIVKWAQKEANPLYPVPEIWDKREMKEFVLAMIEGAEITKREEQRKSSEDSQRQQKENEKIIEKSEKEQVKENQLQNELQREREDEVAQKNQEVKLPKAQEKEKQEEEL